MYKASWDSIRLHPIPQWLMDCKFGIYTHWGVYSVPACGPNATWYGYNMYREGSLQNLYHINQFGDPSQFGYKDFIPLFTGEKFDPDEWAELFRKAGAGFAGPVGEHHDGFTMWNTKYSKWNAFKMGPKRDVVGELAKSIRAQGLKLMVAMHNAENWYFYPHWKKRYDVSNEAYKGLYGPIHNMDWVGKETIIDPNPYIPNHEELWPKMEYPSEEFLNIWLGKLEELIDNYEPDLLWFDFGLKYIQENYKRELVSYYYNKAETLKRDFIIVYKWHSLSPGSGVEDLEQGKREDLTYNFWVTDTTIDDGEAWGYIYNNTYKSPETIIHYLIDNVSKNGGLILSIGPRADGTIPEEIQNILLEIGNWLSINGDAIYGTTPWIVSGEGPTKMIHSGPFCEKDRLKYTGDDIRFTVKGNVLYAICLGRPKSELLLRSVKTYLYPNEIESIELLGHDGPLSWEMTDDGLLVKIPDVLPGNYAYSVKINRRNPYRFY